MLFTYLKTIGDTQYRYVIEGDEYPRVFRWRLINGVAVDGSLERCIYDENSDICHIDLCKFEDAHNVIQTEMFTRQAFKELGHSGHSGHSGYR